MESVRRRAVALILLASLAVGCSESHRSGFAASFAPPVGPPASTNQVTPAATPAATPAVPVPPVPVVSGTRHCWPIVLVHGFPGFRKLGPIDYFYKVPDRLRAAGFDVLVTQETPIQTIEARAQQLNDQILARWPDPRSKVNVIAHSMGGIDARDAIVRLGLGSRVASLTTISAPHRGTAISDVSFGLLPGPLVDATNLLIGGLGWDVTGGKQLSTWYMTTTFDPATPDDPRVAYFSWAGVATPGGLGGNVGLLDAWFLPTWPVLESLQGPNDGLVAVASARWGDFRGTIPADHLQEMGQPVGLTPGFDHELFYERWAIELEARGFGP
jgi:triacylglycerol lipase